MKFGSHIMGISLRHMPDVAHAFELNGIDSVWVPEHLVFPAKIPATYPYTDSGLPEITPDTPSYDPWAVLSFIAAGTTTLMLATNVYILTLRHPLLTARSVVTVDRLSGGRVILGAGVGWLEDEFDYVNMPFKTRGKRADASIDAIRRLWSEDVIEVHDEHFDFGPVKFQPKPVQKPSIPIHIGGSSPAACRRAGRLGDGWIELGSKSLDDFKTKLAIVMKARAEAGRDGPFEVTMPSPLDTSLDGFKRLEDAGVTRVVVAPQAPEGERPTAQAWADWSKRFADEVIAELGD
ncbi:LLM class F420-dependent oxidoreductase [Mycobacterium sp. DL440]|uniref:LLM class F420-dependent oxidoreductase n=1 Tax=Mycobacterium sp. DL440 TaxID=2675523 RepID=UPI00141E6DEB|nr:LLM class F420-dependent oxidoreductase [Mycobacterium sp. DL440]